MALDWRSAVVAVLAGAVGFTGGWVAGRASVPPPPAPAPFVNPLADARKGEYIQMRQIDGTVEATRVLEADDVSLLLSVETKDARGTGTRRQIRVTRSYLGCYHILDGEIDPVEAAAAGREFVWRAAVPDEISLEGRTYRCWRVEGQHRVAGALKFWVSNEVPVHGLLRMDSVRGTLWEMRGSSFAE